MEETAPASTLGQQCIVHTSVAEKRRKNRILSEKSSTLQNLVGNHKGVKDGFPKVQSASPQFGQGTAALGSGNLF